jgi:RimJ/RimL family protein N-acetyltransferase
MRKMRWSKMPESWDFHKITFRKLTETDLLLMHRWLNTPHVSQWWEVDGKRNPDYEEVIKHYVPRFQSSDPTKSYIVVYNETPVAFIQSGLVADNLQYKEALGLGIDTVGIDIFIGEEKYIHKGLGSLIIKAFLRNIVFKVYNVDVCSIDPEPENKIAIRAYEKSGFGHIKTNWSPIEKKWAYVMTINRKSVPQ